MKPPVILVAGEALSRYVAYREELDRMRKKVIAASIYPAILCGVGILVLAFLLLYVVPRFAQAYEDVSGNLPFFSAVRQRSPPVLSWVELPIHAPSPTRRK